ncbi:hypothetical protein HDU85_003291 [Gaertneriomyces sp. JEL0708]|nr:hypothetical protein HDU85_003291 [Gaertneriomyces sp. JEL0708]
MSHTITLTIPISTPPPLAPLPPPRTNILRTHQIAKELSALEKSLEDKRAAIERQKSKVQKLEECVQKEKESTREEEEKRELEKSGVPKRFKHPEEWNYPAPSHTPHPLYITTANQYGHIPPSIHEMPDQFHGLSDKFSKHLNQAGPYRNTALNF